jgi:hypothetical protein
MSQDIQARRQAADQAMADSSAAMQTRESLALKIDKTCDSLLGLIEQYGAVSHEATVAVTQAIMNLHHMPDENTIDRLSLYTGPCNKAVISGALGQVCQRIATAIGSHGGWSVKLHYSTSPDRTAAATTASSTKLLATYLRDLAAPPVVPTQAAEAIADEVTG